MKLPVLAAADYLFAVHPTSPFGIFEVTGPVEHMKGFDLYVAIPTAGHRDIHHLLCLAVV